MLGCSLDALLRGDGEEEPEESETEPEPQPEVEQQGTESAAQEPPAPETMYDGLSLQEVFDAYDTHMDHFSLQIAVGVALVLTAVEAMLFASGDPIGADKLAQAVQLPQLSVEAALEALRERYAREDSGLCLLHLNTRWQLATKTEWADCIRRLLDSRRAVPLGPAAMETLTVIAYNQPVSRAFIEQVRGVDSSSSVSGLLEKGLIEEAGRLDLPGRPVSFRTTDTFLRVFGLSSLADLPPVHGQETETNASPTESEG